MTKIIYTLFLSGTMISCMADSVTEQRFQNPSPDYRPLIVQHSAPLHQGNAMQWLQDRHGGGYVLDAGGNKTPSGEDVVEDEAFINPTYMNVPENFRKLETLIRQLKADGRQAWLYDEYAYPSGSAGGLVLESNPEYSARVIGCRLFSENEEIVLKKDASVFSCVAVPVKKGVMDLSRARDLTKKVRKGGFKFKASGTWKVCLSEIWFSDTWKGHNMGRRLLNVLDRDAVSSFIQTTHEKYAQELGPVLKDVGAFFTDEPQFGSAEFWGRSGRKEADPMIQWTDELVTAFQQKKGYPLQTVIPALFFNAGPETTKYRFDFYDVQTDLMAENYYGQIEDWCHAHGTLSSGHMLLEESLLFHVMFSGSAFKNWARQDLPGMDLLGAMPYRSMAFHWEPEALTFKEDISCKMASSVAHVMAKPGVFSESFATANKATLREILGSTAWQYSEGITHQFTYTIQNHFSAEEYAAYSDFSSRLALFARRGVPVSGIAVLAPEASVWAAYTPPGGGGFARYFKDNPQATKIDDSFRRIAQELLASQKQFECVSESLLRNAEVRDGRLRIGAMSFSTLLLPEMHFIAPGVLEKLEEFAATGGTIQFVGTLPKQDARYGSSPKVERQVKALIRKYSKTVGYSAGLPRDLPEGPVTWSGSDAVRMLVKQDGAETIVILSNPSESPVSGELIFPTLGKTELWDPERGTCLPLEGNPVAIEMGGQTGRVITWVPAKN